MRSEMLSRRYSRLRKQLLINQAWEIEATGRRATDRVA